MPYFALLNQHKFMTKILIVDDEADILEFLSYNLRNAGFEVYTAERGEVALQIAHQVLPHLIVLDIMMPGMDGVEVCRALRKDSVFRDTLIVFLTARREDISQISALDVGGDDYITKPIKPEVFLSRVKALLRRQKPETDEEKQRVNIGDIVIDRQKASLMKGNEQIDLPKKEFELLWLLVSRPGKVFTREEIYTKIWGSDVIVGDRTIDVHIRKLREKIGMENIKTLKGIGYKFDF